MVFETAILGLLEFFGVEWSKFQIRELSELLHGEYGYWSLVELKHFTTKVKTGEYGQLYGKFSPAHFVQYAGEYNGDLLVERANHYSNHKSEPENDEGKEYVTQERMRAVFSQFIDEWNRNIQEHEKAAEMEREVRKKHYKDKQKEMIRSFCEKNSLDFEKVCEEYEL